MPRVLVTLGTDHHQFDRLVSWSDRLAERHPELDVLVQHGRTAAPVVASGVEQVTQAELRKLMREAAAVVAQGGPGGIADAWASGRRPLVVPRLPSLGEIVDGHQLAFARHLHRRGLIGLVETADAMDAAVMEAIHDPARWSMPPAASPTAATAEAVADAVDALLRRRTNRRWRARLSTWANRTNRTNISRR